MSEAEQLYLVLAVLLLIESVCLIGGVSLVFSVGTKRIARCFWPEAFYRHKRGFLALANPLPPYKCFFEQSFPPLSFSPKGVLSCPAFALDTQHWLGCPHSYMGYDQIRHCSVRGEDHALIVNGSAFVHCRDSAEARALADFLMEMVKTSGEKREKRLKDFLAPSFNRKNWEERLSRLFDSSEWLAAFCTFQFFLIFIMMPAIVVFYGFNARVLPTLALIIVNTVLINALFWRLHRRLYPDAFWKRFGSAAKMLICPSIATRALLFSTRRALDGCSPSLAARLLEQPEAARMTLERLLRSLAHPIRTGLSGEASEALAWQQDFFAAETGKLLAELGGSLESALSAPARQNECLSYCPRCNTQYTVKTGSCQDCAGIPLLPFAE